MAGSLGAKSSVDGDYAGWRLDFRWQMTAGAEWREAFTRTPVKQ
jgi:hypothetical protein